MYLTIYVCFIIIVIRIYLSSKNSLYQLKRKNLNMSGLQLELNITKPVAPEESMELDEGEHSGETNQAKRPRLDVGKTITDEEKAKEEKERKLKVLKAIMHFHCWVYTYQKMDITLFSLEIYAEITSILSTIHKLCLQALTLKGSLKTKITDKTIQVVNGVGMPIGELKAAWIKILSVYNFVYVPQAPWLGSMSAQLVLILAFKKRLNEVRITSTVSPSGPTGSPIPLSNYGLGSGEYAHLLEGISYPPHVQSSMIQALGPMTITIGLVECTDSTYQEKWKRSFKTCFGALPMAGDMAEMLAGSKLRHTTLITRLALFANLGLCRNNNKAHLPMALILRANFNETFGAWWTTGCKTEILDSYLLPQVMNFDLSGHGLWGMLDLCMKTLKVKVNNKTCELGPLTLKGTDGEKEMISQWVTHAILGSHKDDLSLLTWMTGSTVKWMKRSEFPKMSQRKKTANIPVTIPKFLRICKLASATQTQFLSGGRGQEARACVFSGKATQEITEKSYLMKKIDEALGSKKFMDNRTILEQLNEILAKIQTVLRVEKRMSFGTTTFYKFDVKAEGKKYGEEEKDVPELKGDYFYGRE